MGASLTLLIKGVSRDPFFWQHPLPPRFLLVDFRFPQIPPSLLINRSRANVAGMVYSYLSILSSFLGLLNRKMYIFCSALSRKNIAFIWSNFDCFSFVDGSLLLLVSFFAAENVFPASELRGFIDIVKTQLDGVVVIIFSLSRIHKTSNGVI